MRAAAILALLMVTIAGFAIASRWAPPEVGGDAATDRAEPDDQPLQFTPVPVDDDAQGPRGPRLSTDPGLDTGGPARADAGWI